jgi:DNA-binding transcriptional regulator YdaS (Cro superfamily)
MSTNPEILRALAYFGNNQSRWARAIGVSRQIVSVWVRGEHGLNREHAQATHRTTGGEINWRRLYGKEDGE